MKTLPLFTVNITMESMMEQLKLFRSMLPKFISVYFSLIWSSKYNFQGIFQPKYQTCYISIIIVIFTQLNPPKGYVYKINS